MAIDTLGYAKRLEAAGVDRAQAEARAEAIRTVVEAGLATKVDLEAAFARLEGKITPLQWMLGFNLAATVGVLWRLLR